MRGPLLAGAIRVLNHVILGARKHKFTRLQYVMFLLADMMTWCEVGTAVCHKASVYKGDQVRSPSYMKATARLFAREVVEKVYLNGQKIVNGCDKTIDDVKDRLDSMKVGMAMKDNLKDMDLVSSELVK